MWHYLSIHAQDITAGIGIFLICLMRDWGPVCEDDDETPGSSTG